MSVKYATVENRYKPGDPCTTTWLPWQITDNVLYDDDVTTVVRTGKTSTPGYWKCVKDHAILPVNPYTTTITRVQTKFSDSLGGFGHPCLRQEWRGHFYSSLSLVPGRLEPTSGGPTPGDISAAVNKAIAQASSGEWSALVTVGEARETFNLVLGAARSLVGIVKDVKKLVVSSQARKRALIKANQWAKLSSSARKELDSLCSFSGAWLQFRYGWMPLVMEVNDVITAYRSTLTQGSRLHGTSIVSGNFSPMQSSTSVNDGWNVTNRTSSTSGKWSIRGFALCEVTGATGGSINLNPVTTAWELLTLSFVLDWFWDIGSFLAANSTQLSGYTLLSSGYTIKRELTYKQSVRVSASPTSQPSGHYGTGGGVDVTTTVTSYERQPGGGGGLPSINLNLSPLRLADLASLLSQAVRALAS